MRRPARLALGVLAATTLLVTPAMVGTSAAAPAKGAAASQSAAKGKAAKKPAAKPGKPGKPGKSAKPAKPSKAKAKVVLVGTVSDTRTVTTQGSATSTVVVTLVVKGGEREYHRKTVEVSVPSSAVVKRNHGKKTRYELQKGDKVTVHARRDAAGALTATYVAASGRNAAPKPVATQPAATSTATTS